MSSLNKERTSKIIIALILISIFLFVVLFFKIDFILVFLGVGFIILFFILIEIYTRIQHNIDRVVNDRRIAYERVIDINFEELKQFQNNMTTFLEKLLDYFEDNIKKLSNRVKKQEKILEKIDKKMKK